MGVYIHIPFCEQKCHYCDFHSIAVGGRDDFLAAADSYLSLLRKEARLYKEQVADHTLSTIFIGGGTPTVLPPEKLGEFIIYIREELPVSPRAEITVEANPNSLSLLGMKTLRQAGVNRISLGAQAFQDPLLQVLGRLHTADQIGAGVGLIRQAGIDNINLDLMFGLPGQTREQWGASLEEAIALHPTHLSCYSLIVEGGTPFAAWESAGLIDLPSDDLQADMYQMAIKCLTAAGFEHYEISNFARPGCESRHNLHYWLNRPFLGLGSGATGYLGRVRYTNVADVAAYCRRLAEGELPIERQEYVSLEQEMDETMMVGMRLLAGVSESDFWQRYGMSFFDIYRLQISDLIARGLVNYANGHLHVTEQGLFLENIVSGAFLR
ncbi:MAG TPA: radical SAM family heme chaperone HemW [Firmicutes bacterium]|nr:radical SAM family heme chaperone HemW [Bacillota bacterium]